MNLIAILKTLIALAIVAGINAQFQRPRHTRNFEIEKADSLKSAFGFVLPDTFKQSLVTKDNEKQ